jgi:hypothetical protein
MGVDDDALRGDMQVSRAMERAIAFAVTAGTVAGGAWLLGSPRSEAPGAPADPVAPAGPSTSTSTTTTPSPAPAPAAPEPAPAPAPAAREGVLLIGDSLSVGTDQPLRDALAGTDVQVDARGGRPLSEGMERYHAMADKPRVVVMGLFTNNDPAPEKLGALESAIDTTVADARARGGIVAWYTVSRPTYKGVDYGAVNELITSKAAENADVMRVIDWAGAVADDPGLLGSDRIHSGPQGYAHRAAMTIDAIQD